MKTMNCKQLGGACEKEFQADSFEEIAEMSKKHGIEMLKINDEAHLNAMCEMQELIKDPEEMANWLESKKNEFEALADDQKMK